jgi:hypothetical protein
MIVRNVDKHQDHYEYNPFIFDGHFFAFEKPYYIKTKIVPYGSYCPYNKLDNEYIQMLEFYE